MKHSKAYAHPGGKANIKGKSQKAHMGLQGTSHPPKASRKGSTGGHGASSGSRGYNLFKSFQF
jgi:hypothetical protein